MSEYTLTHTGAQIDSILDNAASDHQKIGAANGIAPLGSDSKVPGSNLPGLYAVTQFATVMSGAGITVSTGTPPSGDTWIMAVVWLKGSGLSGRFALHCTPLADVPVPASEGDVSTEVAGGGDQGDGTTIELGAYYADWPGRADLCAANGTPRADRLYLCRDTGCLYDRDPQDASALRLLTSPPAYV